MLRRIGVFFREALWQEDLARASGLRAVALSVLRVIVHAFRSFAQNMGSIRAAGLSLITLLAIVPLLALITALGRAFDYGEWLKGEITHYAEANLSEPLQEAVRQIQAMAAGTNFRAIGVIGTLILAYAGFELFTRVEQAFNHVWKSERRRKWYRRIVDFIGLVVIVPLLVFGALSLSSLLQGATLHGLRDKYVWVRAVYEAGLGFVPHALMWVALTALYKVMPSGHVSWRGAVVGGIVAGSSWILLHAIYIHFQLGVAQFSAIYATLAVLPLMIVYLQLTWTILLMGAELAYGVQNISALRNAQTVPPVTHAVRRRLALLVMGEASQKFARGDGGCDLSEIAVRCDVPRDWIDGVVLSLSKAGLVARLAGSEQIIPARPPGRITTLEVLRALEIGEADTFLDQICLPPEMEGRLNALRAAEESVPKTEFGGGTRPPHSAS
jgi:membrane protein